MKWTLAALTKRLKASDLPIIVDESEGFVRVHDPRVFHAHNRAFCQRWAEVASRASNVTEARVDLPSATCQIDFRPGTIDREGMARSFSESIFDALTAPAAPSEYGTIPSSWQALQATPFGVQALSSPSGTEANPSRTTRTRDYALAIGSVLMTGVALIVPGVPTIPFLLASSYYLARTSPKLDRALRSAPFFGPILQELEEHKALSRRSKHKLMGFTVVVISITMLTTSPPFILFLMVAAIVSLASIEGMPEIKAEPATHLALYPAT